MPTPTTEQLDQATIDLIFVLRDSLTDDSPSRRDFWGGRCTTAIQTAAAGADNAAHAITIAARKLQIEVLTTEASKRASKAAAIIDMDYQKWETHIDQTLIYIVALAKIQNSTQKAKKTTETQENIPF